MSWQKSKVIKILELNIGIAIIDTIVFSPGLLGIAIGAGAFATALGVTTIFMSIVIFGYGNYNLLIEKEKTIQVSEIKTAEDYIDVLNHNYDKRI